MGKLPRKTLKRAKMAQDWKVLVPIKNRPDMGRMIKRSPEVWRRLNENIDEVVKGGRLKTIRDGPNSL